MARRGLRAGRASYIYIYVGSWPPNIRSVGDRKRQGYIVGIDVPMQSRLHRFPHTDPQRMILCDVLYIMVKGCMGQEDKINVYKRK